MPHGGCAATICVSFSLFVIRLQSVRFLFGFSNPRAYRKEDPPVTIQQARLAAVSAPVYTLPVRR